MRPFSFNKINFEKGAITSMTGTLLACLLGQPRIFFSLAQDGFLPVSLFGERDENGEIKKKSLLVSSAIVALLAGFLNVDVIIDMVSFGTLMNFSVVSAGVVIARFHEAGNQIITTRGRHAVVAFCFMTYFSWVALSSNLAAGITLLALSFVIFAYLCYLFYVVQSHCVKNASFISKHTGFLCPLVPLIPCASICLNSRFMSAIDGKGILCFMAVFFVGLAIYMSYGYKNSELRKPRKS
jgi:APA family basic amino acid/polyamine antiporter